MADSPAPLDGRKDLARIRDNWRGESSKATLYRELSDGTADPRLAGALRRLSDLEGVQAEYWAGLLPPDLREDGAGLRFSHRVVLWLGRRFGPRAVLPILAADAVRGAEAYRTQPEAVPVLTNELEVASLAAALARAPTPSVDVAADHRRHTAAGGSLRAAVFGVNDGLVSNLSLVMGVAGAAPPPAFILLAGLAGLLAGAFSMAAGEYISVLSQRELFERQLEIERRHLAQAPATERALLARRYEEKGIPGSQAEVVADQLLADPERALDTVAREQLGLDPDDLGSPYTAATASFLAFGLGAVVPLAPFLLAGGWTAVLWSAALSAVALFLVGVGVSLFTGRQAVLSGARQLAIGTAAAGVTFAIGRLIGVGAVG
jgi:VIT1/CCC1 family predicted Fe2+/Mn2+ transporter